jgi:hypothetical protein
MHESGISSSYYYNKRLLNPASIQVELGPANQAINAVVRSLEAADYKMSDEKAARVARRLKAALLEIEEALDAIG